MLYKINIYILYTLGPGQTLQQSDSILIVNVNKGPFTSQIIFPTVTGVFTGPDVISFHCSSAFNKGSKKRVFFPCQVFKV